MAALLWQINSVGEQNNSVKTCFLRNSIQRLLQTTISCLCRSNKGAVGGSVAGDEDRLVGKKAQKTGRIWSIIIFCLFERDLACRWIGCIPLWAYSCRVVNTRAGSLSAGGALLKCISIRQAVRTNRNSLPLVIDIHPRDVQWGRVWPSDSCTHLAIHYFILLTL